MSGNDKVQVIFLQGESAYNIGLRFLSDFALAFTEMGFDVRVLDMTKPNFMGELAKIKGKVKFFFNYNGQGHKIKVQNKSLFDILKTPFVSWFVDHPCYNLGRIQSGIQSQLSLFNDQNHAVQASAITHNPTSIGFLPLAGIKRPYGDLKPLAERTHDITFMGALPDLEVLQSEIVASNAPLNGVLDAIIEEALFDSDSDLLEIILRHFEEENVEPHYRDISFLFRLYISLDQYIRASRRINLISSIKTHRVKVFGNGWKKCKALGANIEVLDNIDVEASLDVIADSKIVINILPNIKNGPNDRIYTAMLQGCVLLTDTNTYLRDQLVNDQNAAIFDLKEPNLDERIADLLSNPDKAQAIASEGQTYADENHTWLHRAQLLNQTVNAHIATKRAAAV